MQEASSASERRRRRAGKLLEKIINTADFVGVRYLDAGVAAARAVGRVNIRDAAGRLQPASAPARSSPPRCC